ARQRPEPGARSAGENDWYEHGASESVGSLGATDHAVAAADGVVFQAEALDELRIVQIPAVEDDRRAELGLHHFEVWAAELLPFGDDRERIGAAQRLCGAFDELHRLGALIDALRLLA